MSNIVSNGLIGTHPMVTTFKRDSTEPLVIKLQDVLKLMNQYETVTQTAPGFWNVNVALKGAPTTSWAYNKITLAANASSVLPIIVLGGETDFNAIETGSYYQNLTTGEVFFVNNKVYESSEYHLYTERGLFGTTAKAQTASDVLVQFNTVVMNSVATAETKGKVTIAPGTGVLANNDTFSISINGVAKNYTMKTAASGAGEITVGANLSAQATNIKTALAADFTDYDVTTSSNSIILTQKTGKGCPITLVFSCTAATAANALTGTLTTDGVTNVYDSGYGQMFFTPMPMPGFGQKFFSNE